MRQPTYFVPHGAGPCFFMDWTMGRPDAWVKTGDWLRGLVKSVPERPKAILVVSAHWEAPVFTVNSGAQPGMFFDYYGFPEHTYRLNFAAPGDPALARRVADLLAGAGLAAAENAERGYDHGVFVPMLLATPDADIPVVELSVRADFDPAAHLAAGRALAPLRDEGVLIVGSGMSWHGGRGASDLANKAQAFDTWLTEAMTDPAERDTAIRDWAKAPFARVGHEREEHLLPLFVVAGAAGDEPGRQAFTDKPGVAVNSGYVFGDA